MHAYVALFTAAWQVSLSPLVRALPLTSHVFRLLQVPNSGNTHTPLIWLHLVPRTQAHSTAPDALAFALYFFAFLFLHIFCSQAIPRQSPPFSCQTSGHASPYSSAPLVPCHPISLPLNIPCSQTPGSEIRIYIYIIYVRTMYIYIYTMYMYAQFVQ